MNWFLLYQTKRENILIEKSQMNILFVFRLWTQVLRQEKYMYLFSTNFVLDFVNIPKRNNYTDIISSCNLPFALHQYIDYK